MSLKDIKLKWLIIGVTIAVVLGGGVYLVSSKGVSTGKVYEDSTYGFRFTYPIDATATTVQSRDLVLMGGEIESIPLPEGSVAVSSLVISPIPYSAFSLENPIYDYDSCCSGRRYWYDSEENAWHAQTIDMYADDGTHLTGDAQFTPLPLTTEGLCSLLESFGTKSFYKIVSGDEGVPDIYYYFMLTDRGHAIRILSPDDLKVEGSVMSNIIASLSLAGKASEVVASCK